MRCQPLSKSIASKQSAIVGRWQKVAGRSPGSLHLLLTLLVTYLLAQIHQYTLVVVARPMAQGIGFGSKTCRANLTIRPCTEHSCTAADPSPEILPGTLPRTPPEVFPKAPPGTALKPLPTIPPENQIGGAAAQSLESAAHTIAADNDTVERSPQADTRPGSQPGSQAGSQRDSGSAGSQPLDCAEVLYEPAGQQYNVLIGPAFFFFFTATGVPLGILADFYGRKAILGTCLLLWSACTICTGFVTSYWQLLLLRIGVAVGESVCVPLCTSLIADHFSQTTRGAALGFFSLGTNAGYSLAFTLGNLITRANFYGQGWRWAFIVTGLPGIMHSFIISLTVSEPALPAKRRRCPAGGCGGARLGVSLGRLLRPFSRPAVLSLTVAAAVRLTVGIMWAYNVQLYFEATGESSHSIAGWLSWIPLTAGSAGALLGGLLSDVLRARAGLSGRVWVLVLSQLAAAPFAAAALYLRPPHAYYPLLPVYLLGEMFLSVCTAVLVELVSADVRSSTLAVFAFITTNVGGSLQLLLEPIVAAFGPSADSHEHAFRLGLYVLFPGGYALSGLLFAVTLLCLRADEQAAAPRHRRHSPVHTVHLKSILPDGLVHGPAPAPGHTLHHKSILSDGLAHSPAPAPGHSPAPVPHSPAPAPGHTLHLKSILPDGLVHGPAPAPGHTLHHKSILPDGLVHGPAPAPEHSPAPAPRSPAPAPGHTLHHKGILPDGLAHSPAPAPRRPAPGHSPAPAPHSPAPRHSPVPFPHSPVPVLHSPAPSPRSPAPPPHCPPARHSPAPSPRRQDPGLSPASATWSSASSHKCLSLSLPVEHSPNPVPHSLVSGPTPAPAPHSPTLGTQPNSYPMQSVTGTQSGTCPTSELAASPGVLTWTGMSDSPPTGMRATEIVASRKR